MQVMIATETYAPSVNGPAVFTHRLAAGLADRGHDVVVVAPSPTGSALSQTAGRLTVLGVRSLPTPYPGQRGAVLSRRGGAALVAKFRPDVVHVQSHFILSRALARAAHLDRIPVVGTNHFVPNNILPHAPGILLRFGATRRSIQRLLWRHLITFLERLDGVTVPSHAAGALLRAHGLKAPIHVISNGVDLSRFHPGGGRDRPARPWPAPKLIVLYVGRLDRDKGLPTLVEAMSSVVAQRPADLVLCGRGRSASQLRRQSRALGIAASVHFPGHVTDDRLPDLYRAAAVFVMPSTNELQSMATLEAMASGLPVVAAEALALPELVRDGDNGFLVPPGQPHVLADRLGRLLADPAERARMGSASRWAAQGHRLDRTLAAFERVYHGLLGSRPALRA
jgi:1,2-diacylglycerol 3-alpha-glucosyltransferase